MSEEYRKWSEEQRKELEEIDKRKEELDRKVLEWETREELINIIIKLQKKNLNLSVGIDLLNNKIEKVIEYMENWNDNWYSNSQQEDKENLIGLLEILKDSGVDE